MLGVNMKGVDAAGGNRPGAGGYVIRITRVTNRMQKQDIEIEYDIIEGEFSGYYMDLFQRRKFWGAKFYKSYKEGALPFLRSFVDTIIECNPGSQDILVGENEDIDETKLQGKIIGIVYGMEEYIGNDGKLKQRPDYFGAEFITPDRIRAGEFSVPDLKPMDNSSMQPSSAGVVDTTTGFGPQRDDDIPF